ncbi:MAG: putative molybdenum carrier protein [Gammaproteobacteria bacterium]|nr:putative molybdenum carrier protein [Gammaproteobacteria bacterium]MBT8443943.1 putative molybdenum carrier protein [Gammaproteobacteria bacterium]NND37474.1 molybdenum cofactor carrier [Gammaproteobacteria bacterium]NNL35691.1 molybdenum cofactor carrier [Silicimonas sp.]
MLERIVSGGQTGADRAALDAALEVGLEIGGWVPRGRRAEDGVVPGRYAGLVETEDDAYEARTELNVRDSDATAIFCFGEPAGGAAFTVDCARRIGKPLLILDLRHCSGDEAAERMRAWLDATGPRVLNIAGPRASEDPRIASAVAGILIPVLEQHVKGATGA